MMTHYILDENGEVAPCDTLAEWANWFEKNDGARRIARTTIGAFDISTVFLGIDHNWGQGRPVVFETMVFAKGSSADQDIDRYSTRAEALAGHEAMCNKVRMLLGQDPK